ncbi:MAG TPA: radical SAM family heme chaperone HemW [Longimicrobiaceae bacterium]|nr:radical SAM family heme chaperone HemW [Longimicrobiaceae bacterium]
MQPRSLYVHVPFCARRCFYCDFAVEATREPPIADWIEAVGHEIALTAADRGWAEPLVLETLYVGGGTPSLLGSGAMDALLGALAPFARLGAGAEWTCEANPESFTPELAADWRAAGVDRISLGAQTFSPEALRWMGRLHGPDGPARAVTAARVAGIDNISIDLIFGLPDHLERSWSEDLGRALELEPAHVSLYGLTAEAGAPLGRRVAEGRERLAGEDRYADEYLFAHQRLTEAGYEHYEVSNFAQPGARSRHNQVYWTGEPYAALGPGAHAFYPPLRRWNLRSWTAYRDSVVTGTLPLDDEERIGQETGSMEAIWLGLRTDAGYRTSRLSQAGRERIAGWQRQGLAKLGDGRVWLTPEGWLLLDRLAVELAGADDGAVPRPAPRIDAAEPLVQISTTSNL